MIVQRLLRRVKKELGFLHTFTIEYSFENNEDEQPSFDLDGEQIKQITYNR